ncbi:MAG: hypothetical protein IKP31_06000 [Lachnospiraceae bacterium]|nr:hypothetical protein [Lachnospiraceae bacterium]
MARKTDGGAKRIVIMLILAAIVVGGFAILAFRNKPDVATPATLTPVEEVLARDLATNYPTTPKEVLKYYSEITRCFYSESYTPEQLSELAAKSRELLDDQLRAQQNDDDYLNDLKTSVDIFKSQDRYISSYSVSGATDIDYYRYEGADWAKAFCLFTVRDGKKMVATQEEFLLRKDTTGHWKIFGWRIYDDKDSEAKNQ